MDQEKRIKCAVTTCNAKTRATIVVQLLLQKQLAAKLKDENQKPDYSENKQPSLLAPASTQSSASDLMEINIWGSVETCALNILPFLSFQIRQQTKANSVSKPFCKLPGSNALNSSHLSMMEHEILGSDRLTPRVAKIACQTCKVTEQEANR